MEEEEEEEELDKEFDRRKFYLRWMVVENTIIITLRRYI